MKPITNEIQFFGTSQKEMMNSFANTLISIYNDMGGDLPPYMETWFGTEKSGLMALIYKVKCLVFYRGDPLSVPIFLKRVSIGKIKMQSQPAQVYDTKKEDYQLGLGHFRCHGHAYTLTPIELKALRQYLTGQKGKVSVIGLNGLKYKMLDITACLHKQGVKWATDDKMLHNKFLITVTNTDTGEQANFYFYGSYHDAQNHVTELKEQDLLNAFECFVSDGIAGLDSFESFCDNLGSDSDSRASERIYKECIKSAEKLKSVINEDLYDFLK